MFRGIIFDLDDTLVDSALLRHLREARLWKEAVARVGETRLFDGVQETLQQLSDTGLPWVIVTTSVSFYANTLLDCHGIAGLTCIAFHDAKPKPSPEPVELALERMKLTAADVIGVGDAETDLRAYHGAGITAVGAGWSPVMQDGHWDAIANSPTDLLLFFPQIDRD